MSYHITVTQRHKEIPKGTKAKAQKRSGQTMYKFKADSNDFDFVYLSWNYIQNHKQYFNVKQQDNG